MATTAESSPFTADERNKLDEQIRRAQQFEKQEDIDLMRQPLEGQLLKFTNAFQGYQTRWFLLDPARAELSYYLKEEHKQSKRPRGTLNLNGATIVPSEDDSLAFSVCPAIGEPTYRLRASDTKQKTEWINRMRTASEEQRERRLRDTLNESVKTPAIPEPVRHGIAREAAVLHNVYKVLSAMSDQLHVLNRNVNALPEKGRLDPNVLTLRSLALATFGCIEQSWTTLNELQACGITSVLSNNQQIERTSARRDSGRSNDLAKSHSLSTSTTNSSLNRSQNHQQNAGGDEQQNRHNSFFTYDENEETECESGVAFVEPEIGSVETQKVLILALLSGLKLGTDLTRVPLPTFILQSRSMLEMFSDFFANAPYFLKIADPNNASKVEDRLLAIVKWFLTSFYFGCKDAAARKPYNPALGEIFRCSWDAAGHGKIRFTAEQVSHHPPISAFFAACPERGIYLNGCVSPKSKFMGTSLCAAMVGEVRIAARASDGNWETFRFTLPTCFARSILTTPWIELGGKCNIVSVQHGDTSAAVTFHTKPFYGGTLHHVTGEIKSNTNGRTFCRLRGEWNKQIEFTYDEANASETLDVPGIGWTTRRVRPLEKQHVRESRRLWQNVTAALRKGDYELAVVEKKIVEDRQRGSESSLYVPTFFEKCKAGGSCESLNVMNNNGGAGNSEIYTFIHKDMPRLPIYKPSEQYVYVEDSQPLLLPYVSSIRQFFIPTYDIVSDTVVSTENLRHSITGPFHRISEYAAQDHKYQLPKAAAITLGGMAGFMYGLKRGGLATRAFYSGTSMLIVAAFCYPHETMDIGRSTAGDLKKRLKDFIEPPMPPTPPSLTAKSDDQPSPGSQGTSKDIGLYTMRSTKVH